MTSCIIEITTTVATLEQARILARTLVERRLAACVQIVTGVRSHYRWKDQVCDDEEEQRLTIKSLAECESRILELFAEQHPYELPEFIASTVRASEAYADWVRTQVDAGA